MLRFILELYQPDFTICIGASLIGTFVNAYFLTLFQTSPLMYIAFTSIFLLAMRAL